MESLAIRRATPADSALLSRIERESPLVLDGLAMHIDRGDDYFAAARLMGDPVVLLAEVDGEPAGIFCGVRHPARIGGTNRQLLYVHHARILPRFQRHGLGRKMGERLREEYGGEYDSQYWYISDDNRTSQGFARGAQNKWSIGVDLLTIDTAATAGPAFGRPAAPPDAAQIAAILNTAHDGEEMFLPYDEARLTERLSRDPAQYSWPNLLLTERAVVGVWPEGRWVTHYLVGPSGESVSRGAAVLDYGCLPGGEKELQALIHAHCAALTAEGMDSLSLFTSAPARLDSIVRPLAASAKHFDFWTPQISEPEGAANRGLYVDHIYF